MNPRTFPPLCEVPLPDGTKLWALNASEAAFVMEEIFVEEAYPLNDLGPMSDPVVIDVGANIGVFGRYVMGRYPQAQLLAFEPAPQLFEVLSQNLAAHRSQVVLECCGLADAEGEAEFTFYPHYSLLSGFHAERGEDERLLKQGIRAQLENRPRLAGKVTERHVDALAEGRLAEAETLRCPLKTLSHFIRREGLTRVDVLKVDAERCERAVLRGIEAAHWPLIQRVYMEVHETQAMDAGTEEMQMLLENQGFHVSLQPSRNDHPRTLLLRARRTP